jgi:carbamoyltransferase
VPETPGRAIGAALSGGSAPAGPIATLALGPDFTESQIKVVLENCRLDYLYEPDWKRLLTRISGMLSQGKVIAWFQGAMEFGPRSLGSRSILCDPSSRYARANINGYLKHRPEDFPMAVSMTEAAADTCLVTPLRSPYMSFQAVVRPDWRDSLRAALDHRQSCPVHTVTAEQSPYLWALLDLHWKEAKVPGLINTTLNAPGEPVACTARDAIRTTFSSAIDALVLGRFLLMKDYWLLRSDADLCPGRR